VTVKNLVVPFSGALEVTRSQNASLPEQNLAASEVSHRGQGDRFATPGLAVLQKAMRQDVTLGTRWGVPKCRSFRGWRRPRTSIFFVFSVVRDFDDLVTQVPPQNGGGDRRATCLSSSWGWMGSLGPLGLPQSHMASPPKIYGRVAWPLAV
jgi:hypothetical protein